MPFEFSEVFLGGAATVKACSVDFTVAMRLEYGEDLGAVLQGGDAGLFGAVAEGHGAKDDGDGGFGSGGCHVCGIWVVIVGGRNLEG